MEKVVLTESVLADGVRSTCSRGAVTAPNAGRVCRSGGIGMLPLRKSTIALLGCIVVLPGCSFFSPPAQKPIVSDKVGVLAPNAEGKGEVRTLGISAGRRLLLINAANGRICAEPPPDAAENAASALSLTASLSEKEKAAVDAASKVQFDQLFSRTQGADFFRQAAFHLCLQFMNGALTREDYTIYYIALAEKSFALSEKEVTALAGKAGTPLTEGAPRAQSFSELIKSLKSDIAALKTDPPVCKEGQTPEKDDCKKAAGVE
jgi:hypothetical protein